MIYLTDRTLGSRYITRGSCIPLLLQIYSNLKNYNNSNQIKPLISVLWCSLHYSITFFVLYHSDPVIVQLLTTKKVLNCSLQ